MLSEIREKFTGWIALTILGMIGVTFVFFGGVTPPAPFPECGSTPDVGFEECPVSSTPCGE